MNTPENQEFESIINTQEWGPYGTPATHTNQHVKPGLTKRGKVALAIGATVIAGGSMLAWQDYTENAQNNEIRAHELVLQQQQLEVEKLKELNKAATRNAKEQATEDAATQKLIDTCIDTDKGLVGKQMGVTYSSIVADCRSEYAGTSAGSDMQAAASTSDTSSGAGGISPTALAVIGGGGALLIAIAANRGKKNPTT